MADAARPGRARRRRVRLVAAGVLAAAILLAGAMLWRAHAVGDPQRALSDGNTAYATGNYSAARNHALTALARLPQSAPALVLLARAYLQLGDGAAAEGAVARAGEAGASAAGLAGMRAQARFLQADYQGALDAAAAALAGDPLAARVRARLLATQGNSGAAAQALAALVARVPRDAGAWADLGRVRLDGGDNAGATAAAAHALRLAPGDPVTLTLAGEVVRTRYGLAAALPWFAAALKRDAFFHPALIDYAATLGDSGRYADMLAATRRAQAARPGSAQAFYLQVVLAARAGRVDLARELLQRLGSQPGGPAGVALLAGGLDYAAGQYERAIGSWRQILNDQPLNLVVRRLLGAALLRSGDVAGALETLRPLALRGDADAYTLTLVARAFEAAGDRAAAAGFLDRAGFGGRGDAAAFASDDPVAAAVADAADAPSDPGYVLGVIRAQLTAGDRTGALQRAGVLAASSPGAPAAQLAQGDALAALGRYPDAAAAYARAAILAFDEPTMLRLVDAWTRAGQPQRAAAVLSLYLQQNPQSVAAERLRGHWQRIAGDDAAAIETLEAVRRMVGNRNAALLADLAYAYAAVGDGTVAARYARAAYRLAPLDPVVCDAYAVALAAAGDLAGARQLAVKAVALAPKDPIIAAHAVQIRR